VCAGQVGRVVVTDLHNFATPLIRYDLGDYAEMADTCPCGRGLPALKRIMGRRRNMVRLPDGRSFGHPSGIFVIGRLPRSGSFSLSSASATRLKYAWFPMRR